MMRGTEIEDSLLIAGSGWPAKRRQSGAGRRIRYPVVANGHSVLLINLLSGRLYHLDSSLEVEGDDGEKIPSLMMPCLESFHCSISEQ